MCIFSVLEVINICKPKSDIILCWCTSPTAYQGCTSSKCWWLSWETKRSPPKKVSKWGLPQKRNQFWRPNWCLVLQEQNINHTGLSTLCLSPPPLYPSLVAAVNRHRHRHRRPAAPRLVIFAPEGSSVLGKEVKRQKVPPSPTRPAPGVDADERPPAVDRDEDRKTRIPGREKQKAMR